MNNLTLHLRQPEIEQMKPKVSRRGKKKSLKIRAEINVETKKIVAKIHETKR